MNTNIVKAAGLSKHVARAGLQLKKHSPQILTTAGIAGLVTSGVLACRATLKVEPVIDGLRQGLKNIESVKGSEGYSEQDRLRDLTATYTRGVTGLVKLYWPALTLGMASIACIVGAHGIMQKRNAALAIAYNAVEKSFKAYKDRVEAEVGPEKARELARPIQTKEVETTEDGKKKTEVKQFLDIDGASPYARFFDNSSSQWSGFHDQNLLFLKCQQQYANNLLKARGHLFLNEVYNNLGIEHSMEGAVVGWIWNGDGDNFVDFGIDEELIMGASNNNGINFVDDRYILLEFNVDGTIFNKI